MDSSFTVLVGKTGQIVYHGSTGVERRFAPIDKKAPVEKNGLALRALLCGDGYRSPRRVKPPQPEIDVHLRVEGNLILFTPQNALALEWLQNNTDGCWHWKSLAVEQRYAESLCRALGEAGFVLKGEAH